MATEFSVLETNILKAKGLSPDQVAQLSAAGINSREDLQTVGDAGTLVELATGLDPAIAEKVILWATGRAEARAAVASVRAAQTATPATNT